MARSTCGRTGCVRRVVPGHIGSEGGFCSGLCQMLASPSYRALQAERRRQAAAVKAARVRNLRRARRALRAA